MKNAPDPPKAPAGSANSGARNDDSSLFSLEALKLSPAAKQMKPKDDSGLIDLNTLGVIEHQQGTAARAPLAVAPVVAPNDIFGNAGSPLLVAPSPGSVAAGTLGIEGAPSKGKGVVLIAFAVVAVAIAAGVFAATRGGDTAATAVTAKATATAAPEPTPTAAAPEPTIAAVTPGQRAAAEPIATATAAATVPKAPGQHHAQAPATPKTAAPAAPDPPPKPVETCDLACQMQRAVQKK